MSELTRPDALELAWWRDFALHVEVDGDLPATGSMLLGERFEVRLANASDVTGARLVDLLTPTRLRRVADCLDELDRRRGVSGDDEMQRDIRAWADGVERGEIT